MNKVEQGSIPAMTAFGTALGSRLLTNADMDAYIQSKRPGTVARLMREVGIETRHWVKSGEEATSDLCAAALKEALERRGITPSQISALWVGTSSPDYLGVSTAAIVQDKLGLPTSILGSNNADACPGWIHAINRAMTNLTSPFGEGGIHAVIGAEVISQSLSPQKGVVSVLFGDAAGATLVENVVPDEGAPTNTGFAFGLDGSLAEELGITAGGSKYRPSHETLDRDEHGIHMNGPVIFEQAVLRMTEVTKQALDRAGLPIEEVDLFIPHQANLQIIRATAEALNVPMEKVMVTIDHYGNTSAASIPTALAEAVAQGKISRNQILATAAFGAGLVFNAAVFVMVGLPKK